MLPFKTIVAFGDSFSAQCGTSWDPSIGSLVTNPRSWTDFRSGMFGNPIFGDCSVSGGFNWLNYLTNCTQDGIDPLTCPISLIDLAYADSHVSPESEGGKEANDAASLTGQLENWRNHVAPRLDLRGSETLVSLFFGSSDLVRMSAQEVQLSTSEVEISNSLALIESTMATLYTAGLQHFLVFNVPEIDRKASLLYNEWNKELETSTRLFLLDRPDAMVYSMDISSLYNSFLSIPDQYGFTNTKDSCFAAQILDKKVDCTETSDYLLADSFHWTLKAHIQLAAAVENVIMHQVDTTSASKDNASHAAAGSDTVVTDGFITRVKETVFKNRVAAILLALGIALMGLLLILIFPITRRRALSSLSFLYKSRRRTADPSTYTRVANHETEDDIELRDNRQTGANFKRSSHEDDSSKVERSLPPDDFDI